jgi:hypothetical protein
LTLDLVDFHKQENSGRHYLHIQATIDLLALGLLANPSAMGLLAEELETVPAGLVFHLCAA